MAQHSEFEFSVEFDTEYLNRNYADKLIFLNKMFEVFLKDIEEDLAKLGDAVVTNNYEICEKICHKIKNNFAHIGLPELHKITAILENEAKKKQSDLKEFYDSAKFDFAVKSVIFEKQRLTTHLSI